MAWTQKRETKKHGVRYRGAFRTPKGDIVYGPHESSKPKALKWARDEEAKIRLGVWADPAAGKMTLETYFTEHWLPHRDLELNSTLYYERMFGQFPEELRQMQLNKIDSFYLQRWVSSMTRPKDGSKPVAPRTAAGRLKALSTILGAERGVSAVRDKLIVENPCLGVDPPKYDRREVHVYDLDEVEALIIRMGWWAPLVLAAAETGARWGELMGLKVMDLNAERNEVTFNRVLLEVPLSHSDNGTSFMYKERLKTQASRRIAISPELGVTMGQLIRSRRLFSPEDRLFSRPSRDHDGLPMRTDEWPEGLPPFRRSVRDAWLRAHEEAGIEREGRRFHDLRGSHITWLMSENTDLATIMARVGHTQITTTNAYLAAMKNADTRALEALKTAKRRPRAVRAS